MAEIFDFLKHGDDRLSLYKECKKSMEGGAEISLEEVAPNTSLITSEDDSHSWSTVPSHLWGNDTNGLIAILQSSIYYISDLHLFHHIMAKYPKGATKEQMKDFIKEFVGKMLTVDFKKHGRHLFIGGDVSHSFQLSTLFYTELRSQLDAIGNGQHYVYAVLGNHELWDFQTLEECQEAYQKMLEPLHITLLCNQGQYLFFTPPARYAGFDEKKGKSILNPIDPEKEPELFDKELIGRSGFCLIGGTGFAGLNEKHNANNGYYRHVLNRQKEIEETEKWRELYKLGLEKARKIRGQLIVLTHNPIQDWMGEDFCGDPNCIYFNGHNHSNLRYHNDDRNVHIYADNQIGYKRKTAKVKEAKLYRRGNPFAGKEDGIYEVNSHDYMEFYAYVMERLQGNGVVERMVGQFGCKFYMVKRSGYYGFFLISDKASYICSGGKIKKLGKKSIQYYYDNFEAMVYAYINALSPYRQAQEEIAEAVRGFGGDGNIHGCIVDIDFTNHIMLNPNDGSLTFYYSPLFGQVQTYASIQNLLEAHSPEILEKYLSGGSTVLTRYKPELVNATDGIVNVDTKTGMYGLSKKVQQLQRLFSCNVLREWNDNLIRVPRKRSIGESESSVQVEL